MRLFLAFTSLAALIAAALGTGCPATWKVVNGYCVNVVQDPTPYAPSWTWLKAAQACDRLQSGATLLQETNEAKIIAALKAVGIPLNYYSYQTAFYEITKSSGYPAPLRNDSNDLSGTIPPCSPGPNGDMPGDCAILTRDRSGNFCRLDRLCTGIQYSVLGFDAIPGLCQFVPPSVECEAGYKVGPDGETCYKYEASTLSSWDDALCSALVEPTPKTLAIVGNVATLIFFNENMPDWTSDETNSYRIGMGYADDRFQWIDGSSSQKYMQCPQRKGKSCFSDDESCATLNHYRALAEPPYDFRMQFDTCYCSLLGRTGSILEYRPGQKPVVDYQVLRKLTENSTSAACNQLRHCLDAQPASGTGPLNCHAATTSRAPVTTSSTTSKSASASPTIIPTASTSTSTSTTTPRPATSTTSTTTTPTTTATLTKTTANTTPTTTKTTTPSTTTSPTMSTSSSSTKNSASKTTNSPPPALSTPLAPSPHKDCQSIAKAGGRSGVHTITVAGKTFRVYCDIRQGKGWIVIQRRANPILDFDRTWAEYKVGFGSLTGSFWLGLDKVSLLTTTADMRLRVDLASDCGGRENRAWEEYEEFLVHPESKKYQLSLGGEARGPLGDSMKASQHGQPFTTKDRHNDDRPFVSCSLLYSGGWWFNGRLSCGGANLNGVAYASCPASPRSMFWQTWELQSRLRPTSAQMAIRPFV